MSLIKAINCIYIPTTDTEKAATWYMQNLGLELLAPCTDNQAQLQIPSGPSIFLIKTPKPTTLNYIEISGTEQCTLTLEVLDFHTLYNTMKESGAKVSAIEDNASCGLNFYAYDPDGNKLDIWSGWPA
ncbi:VOC family protein [Alkalihalobacterium bogoriense]|uniref:VOC family protein n=1 Tax=Alkalihalobacterium bogoriense TaxID=246272 RepID=UPI00047A0ACC|nr:VOC family protein [Alkalihalobacterium bogoriense]